MKDFNAKKLAVNALAIALVCVGTMVIQIPIPLGYMHLGNCCILLISIYFGNVTGMLAGGVGSCMADLLSGYPQWILPTLIIKGIMGLVIALIGYKKDGEAHIMRVRVAVGAVAGIAVMIAGYTFAGCFLYGSVAAGFAQIPGLSVEGVIGIVLFYVIGFAFEKAKIPAFLRRFA